MEREKQIIELDVRPHLRKKLEPFQLIMETVKSLENDDIFVVHATFKPTPLLGLMTVRGYVHKVERIEKDHWIVSFVNKKYKHLLAVTETEDRDIGGNRSVSKQDKGRAPKSVFLDNRGLEPPQPMMLTLAALDRSQPGDEVNIHNDRVPIFLIEELNALGYPFHIDEQDDGSAKVNIHKK